MYRSILVPIDISETDLTRHVVPQVQAHAKTAKVHFQPLFLPFRSMPRWGWPTLPNSRTEVVCRPRPAKNSKRLLSSSIFLQAGVKLMSFTARQRIRSSNWRNQQTPSLLSSPHINPVLALICWVQRQQPWYATRNVRCWLYGDRVKTGANVLMPFSSRR